MTTTIAVYDWLNAQLTTATGVNVIHGNPDWGRPNTDVPLIAMRLVGLDFPSSLPRIGQQFNYVLLSIQFTLFARNEVELCTMCDAIATWLKSVSPTVNSEVLHLSEPRAERYTPETQNEKESHAMIFAIQIRKSA